MSEALTDEERAACFDQDRAPPEATTHKLVRIIDDLTERLAVAERDLGKQQTAIELACGAAERRGARVKSLETRLEAAERARDGFSGEASRQRDRAERCEATNKIALVELDGSELELKAAEARCAEHISAEVALCETVELLEARIAQAVEILSEPSMWSDFAARAKAALRGE